MRQNCFVHRRQRENIIESIHSRFELSDFCFFPCFFLRYTTDDWQVGSRFKPVTFQPQNVTSLCAQLCAEEPSGTSQRRATSGKRQVNWCNICANTIGLDGRKKRKQTRREVDGVGTISSDPSETKRTGTWFRFRSLSPFEPHQRRQHPAGLKSISRNKVSQNRSNQI